MSHLVMAMEILWVFYPLLILPSVEAAHSHNDPQGMSCVNDFVNNVSCTWHGSPVAPDLNCSIFGTMNYRNKYLINQTCMLEHRIDSPPGCSFAFQNKKFNCFKPLPYIRLECGGKLVDKITNYWMCQHIKMHPPGTPQVNVTTNDTWISWSPGSPLSQFITTFEFNVQIKQKGQMWEEANNMFTQELKLNIKTSELKGHCQVRVRVLPPNRENSTWSNWSPVTSWVGATSQNDQEWPLDLTSLLKMGLILSLVLISVGIPVLYRRCVNKGSHIKEPVPNPSKYFHTLHSVHKGNLKTWLNPYSVPGSFFTAQPCDQISPIKLCDSDSFEVVPSTSPSSCSASALLHLKGCQSVGSDTSGVEDNSSSSSFFSNMGYFLSCSSGRSAQIDSNSAYFPYLDDFHNCNLPPSNFPPFIATPIYESLKWEPQSPDSGFGITLEDEEEHHEENVDEEVEGILDDHQTPPLLILPLHPPYPLCPNPSPPPSPTAPSPSQASSGIQTVDAAAAGGCYVAWPSTGAMCRSSSVPVESSKTGYLTLKELQTTFSNKSF